MVNTLCIIRVWDTLLVIAEANGYGFDTEGRVDNDFGRKAFRLASSCLAVVGANVRSGLGRVGQGFILSLSLLLFSSGFQDRLGSTVLLLPSLALS